MGACQQQPQPVIEPYKGSGVYSYQSLERLSDRVIEPYKGSGEIVQIALSADVRE